MKILYKILRLLNVFIPIKDERRKFRQKLDNLINGNEIKVVQDNYIEVLENLRSKQGKIKAVFLVNENQKWNWQSVYDEMIKSSDFVPLILITNFWQKKKNDKKLSDTSLKENYDFFAKQNLKVEYAYDINTDTYIPLNEFGADIVFYQQPWGLHPCQSVEETSKYALSCYVPYGIPVCNINSEYDMNFYRMMWAYFEINQEMYDFLEEKDMAIVKNRPICGHPKLDTYFNPVKDTENYIIYAPHHSLYPSNLNLATFSWNGEYILEYAKQHPEFKFIFKPHPWLKETIVRSKLMTKEEVDAYYKEWEKVSIYCNDADYFDYFKKSKLLITDCASFIVEYFPSCHPVIHLRSKLAHKFLPMVQKITDCYYPAYDLDELKKLFKMLLEENKDTLAGKRIKTAQEMNFLQEKSSDRIMAYLRQCIK